MLGRKMVYVRCLSCSYNNVAKGIRLLDKKEFLFIQEKFMQVRAFERYIPFNNVFNSTHYSGYTIHSVNIKTTTGTSDKWVVESLSLFYLLFICSRR